MMRWIVESSLRLRFLIVVIAAVLLAFGIVQLREMPIDVYPEFNPPLVEVQTEALGLSAAEVESLITLPMEADLLNGVAWLDKLYSESVSGLSSILLVFDPGTDLIRARQMVQERLIQAFALPNVSKPPVMLQPLSASNRIMMIGLSSKELSLIDMSVLARWTIKPRLMGVPGVANVAIWGQREQQLQILVRPEELHAKGVTLDQVIKTAGEALWVSPLSYLESSSPGTAGFIDTPNQRFNVQHLLPIASPEDLAKVPVVDNEGLTLGDVSTIVEDHQPLIGDAMLKNGSGLLLVVEKFPGVNTLDVTREVQEAMDAMRPGLSGIDIDSSVFRPANYLELALGNLSNVLLISGILMTLLLLLLLANWRSALIALFAITASLIATACVLYLTGVTSLNMMVLAGLVMALGIIIDDAITDVESIANRLHQSNQQQGSQQQGQTGVQTRSNLSIIRESLLSTRSILAFASLIILLAVLPLFFIYGLAGSMLTPVVLSYVIAMLVSILVALLITPALSLLFYGKGDLRSKPAILGGLQHVYAGVMGGVTRAAYPMLMLALVCGVLALGLLPMLRQSFVPELKQTELLIQWDGAPGTSAPAMNRIISQAGNELRAIAGVRNVGAHVGRAITGDQITNINAGEIWVSLEPAADYNATMRAIQEVVDGYPGFLSKIKPNQPTRVNEALIAPDKDLVVRVYGHDFAVLREKAGEVAQLLSGVGGIRNAVAEILAEEPQVEIEVDLAKAEQHQIKPGDVRREASALLSGIQVGNLYQDQKIFDVVVWGVPELRSNLSNLVNLMIDTPAGTQVRLGDVAEVRIVPSPTVIKRDSVARYMDVSANVTGRSLASVLVEVKEKLKGVQMPLEHHVEVLGESMDRQAAWQRMLMILAAALLGIFLVLQAVSSSWRMAFATFFSLPMALAGGVFTAFLAGGVLTLGALFGLFAIVGIAVRHALMTINHMQMLEQTGEAFSPALVQRGANERMAPILTSALTTAAVLVPFVYFGNQVGLEFIRPMAIVILGGLVTSTLLNLLVVPALYLRFGYVPEQERMDLRLTPPVEAKLAPGMGD